ncbi:MAG TPA: helix-turn-helix transcriptional regulator [Polyangiaceae bacterium]|nr:helix-turn-helix transcriptional regulator [Polyangiaceae bacterium]
MPASEAARAFGREVRRRRLAQNMTLYGLGESANLGANYIGEIEAGKRDPSIGVAARLASGLGAPLGEIVGMPGVEGATLEGARLLSKLPRDVRETIVEALRALAIWAERRRA